MNNDLVDLNLTNLSITKKITDVVLTRRQGPYWWLGLFITALLTSSFVIGVIYIFLVGVGIWGINIPVAWGFAIVNFVWWIGIGHAGTFISAILLLLHQKWRTSINRFSEAMTIFAVVCAGIFPLCHLGRPWLFYWIFPYPNTMGIWPQFRSPLVWDFFAISTYFTVSLLFWYMGMIPDLATLRDKATGKIRKKVYGILSLGWRNSSLHWSYLERSSLLLAGLATPLVVSVHSIVSLDFAVANVPGWHSAIFPPYFVAGAIFSGFAMVLTIVIPVRHFFNLENLITKKHITNMALLCIVTGSIVAYGYLVEFSLEWYSGSNFEKHLLINRALGFYAPLFWIMIICNVLVPHIFWFKKLRENMLVVFIVSLLINLGMWLERFIIVIVSLSHNFMASAWRLYFPTFWDWIFLFGTVGLFFFLIFLFIRFLPAISIYEVKDLVHEENSQGKVP
ncbi:MAG: NrfD/PsrC family molybdoenzyme membrane anchor subunit [Pseudobdellovibrionaceae bacterium]